MMEVLNGMQLLMNTISSSSLKIMVISTSIIQMEAHTTMASMNRGNLMKTEKGHMNFGTMKETFGVILLLITLHITTQEMACTVKHAIMLIILTVKQLKSMKMAMN